MVRLLETEQLDDQFAGIAYAKTLPFVDANRWWWRDAHSAGSNHCSRRSAVAA
jgi:hypothetical protein